MKPAVARVIDVAFGHLAEEVAPQLATTYMQSSVVMLGALLAALGEEFERAAARRIEENRELRRIFAMAVEVPEVVADAALGERLGAALAREDADFTVSALERSNVQLRGLLIELHERVEQLDSLPARRIEDEIWRELVASTERRKLAFAPF